MSRRPFTPPLSAEEVDLLGVYQASPWVHPLTCNGGVAPMEHVHDHEVILRPTVDGLLCPECGRIQTWVPKSLHPVLMAWLVED